MEIKKLNTKVRIINHEDRMLNSTEPDKTLGKVFRDATSLNFSIEKIKTGVELLIDYCDFTKNKKSLQKLLAITDENGQKVVTIGKNCEPKPFQHTQHFKSDKKVASFMKDFGVAFETWTRIEKNEDVFVSVQATNDGYNVTF